MKIDDEKYSELITKYGDEELEFESYYKYQFTYGNGFLTVRLGGDRDDIYKSALDRKMKLKDLFNEIGCEYGNFYIDEKAL